MVATLEDKDGKGLKFTAPYNTPLAFSAWHYTQNELCLLYTSPKGCWVTSEYGPVLLA